MFNIQYKQILQNLQSVIFPEFATTNLHDSVILQIFQILSFTKMITCQMMCKEPSIIDVTTCCDFQISNYVYSMEPIILNGHKLTITETNLLLLEYVGMHIVRLTVNYSHFEPTEAIAISRAVRKYCQNLRYFAIDGSAELDDTLVPPHMSAVETFVFDNGDGFGVSILPYLSECRPSVLRSVYLIEFKEYRHNENATRNLSKEQIARVNWFAKSTALREFQYFSNYDISNDLRPILLAIPKLTHLSLRVSNEGDPFQNRFAKEFNKLQTELIRQNHLVYMRLWLRYGAYLPETLDIMTEFTSLRRLRLTGSVVGPGFLHSIMQLRNLRQFLLENSPPHFGGLNFKEVMDFVRGCQPLRKFTIAYDPWYYHEPHLSMLRRLRRDVQINMEHAVSYINIYI